MGKDEYSLISCLERALKEAKQERRVKCKDPFDKGSIPSKKVYKGPRDAYGHPMRYKTQKLKR